MGIVKLGLVEAVGILVVLAPAPCKKRKERGTQ